MQTNLFHMLQNRQQNLTCAKDWFRKQTLENMEKGRCFKTIFKGTPQDETILCIFTRVTEDEEFAITMDKDQTIKRMNLKSGECEWIYRPDSPLENGSLCIAKDSIIHFGGKYRYDQNPDRTIRIINLATGEETTQIPSISDRTYVLGNKIFGLSPVGFITWNTRGLQTQGIYFDRKTDPLNKDISKRFIIDMDTTQLSIYDRNTHTKKLIDFKELDPNIQSISCSYLLDSCLYCGFIGKSPSPAFGKIDLISGKVELYPTSCNQSIYNTVHQILINNETAYLGDSSGNVIAVDLNSKQERVIGKHSSHACYLAFENDILMSGSNETNLNSAEVKLWDAKTLKLIKTMEFPDLRGLAFAKDKVLVAVKEYLVQYDYNWNCSHEGEKLTENSKLELPYTRTNTPQLRSGMTVEDSEMLQDTCHQQ